MAINKIQQALIIPCYRTTNIVVTSSKPNFDMFILIFYFILFFIIKMFYYKAVVYGGPSTHFVKEFWLF